MQKYIKVFHQLFFPLKKIVPYTKQNQLKTLIQKKKKPATSTPFMQNSRKDPLF